MFERLPYEERPLSVERGGVERQPGVKWAVKQSLAAIAHIAVNVSTIRAGSNPTALMKIRDNGARHLGDQTGIVKRLMIPRSH